MTSTSAFSPFVAVTPSPNARGLPQDGHGMGGEAWQRALDGAGAGTVPPAGRAAEAGYLMTLANVGMMPSGAPAISPGAWMTTDPHAPVAANPALHSSHAPQSPATVASPAPVCTRGAMAVRHEVAPQPRVGSAPVEGTGARLPVMARHTRPQREAPAAGRDAGPSHGSVPVPPVEQGVVAPALARTGAVQAIAGYVRAASVLDDAGAPAARERRASFTLSALGSSVPVRVHVQWRGRLADVWIGLHRQAFEQLPDIRAGIDDWVGSRGGAIGCLVCNGETLAGAPSSSFTPGAL